MGTCHVKYISTSGTEVVMAIDLTFREVLVFHAPFSLSTIIGMGVEVGQGSWLVAVEDSKSE